MEWRRPPEHMTVADAAQAFALTPGHLRSLMRRGVVAGEKNGLGRWVVDRRSLAEYAAYPAPAVRALSDRSLLLLADCFAVLAGE